MDSQYAAAENPIFQSKNRFLAVSAPENPQDFSGNWRGAHEGRRLWRKQAVVSPMSKGGPLVRFAHDAERPLRIEDGSGGGARSARPVGEAARSKPNEQGNTASRQAQQGDHCELWIACSPVHQLVKKSFLTSWLLCTCRAVFFLETSANSRAPSQTATAKMTAFFRRQSLTKMQKTTEKVRK